MKTHTIHEAKTNLSRLIQKARDGEEVIIAKGREPVAKIVLIDTHVLLWWWTEEEQLWGRAKAAILDSRNRSYVSAAVAWELALKVNLGKLDARDVVSNLKQLLIEEGFRRLAISTDHALRAGLLPILHRDPFDRMLVAQAQALNSPIVSADAIFDRYGAQRIW